MTTITITTITTITITILIIIIMTSPIMMLVGETTVVFVLLTVYYAIVDSV
jgi:hypothetical protein